MAINKSSPVPGQRVLVINPNTSTSLTDSFKPILSALELSQNVELSYWTCPPGGPAMIKSQADMHDSATRCLPLLLDLAPAYDGFLAACYADHPVVRLLQSQVGSKPVVCIFHASIYAALQLAGPNPAAQFGIITTATIYETLLTSAVKMILRSNKQALARFAGVAASGVGLAEVQVDEVTDLKQQAETARSKVKTATKKLLRSQKGGQVLCMGGVVLAGMEHWVHEACEEEGRPGILVVDQLAAGMLTLDALLGEKLLRTVDYHQALK